METRVMLDEITYLINLITTDLVPAFVLYWFKYLVIKIQVTIN